MDDTQDRYAGDGAWRQWFEICSVAGCGEEDARRLRAQIVSAMMRRLAVCGVSPEETQGEDPVAFFDAFFQLRGSREGAKPLKLWFAHRIRAEGLAMRDFVCGTLFGAVSGRVHDIVVDWIAALKGWRPRTLRGEDGRRRREEGELALPLRIRGRWLGLRLRRLDRGGLCRSAGVLLRGRRGRCLLLAHRVCPFLS